MFLNKQLIILALLIVLAAGLGATTKIVSDRQNPEKIATNGAENSVGGEFSEVDNKSMQDRIGDFLGLEKRSVAEESSSKSSSESLAVAKKSGSLENTKCEGTLANQLSCYSTFYDNLIQTKSVAAAFIDLKARYEKDPYVKSQCHQIVHVIGRAAAKKFDRASEAFLQGDSICWSGYFHGVMEGVIRKNGNKPLTSEFLDNICSDIPGKTKYSFDYYNCVHGLGHGVMFRNDNELFTSLTACDLLSGDWEKQSCSGGAFMENVIADSIEHKAKYLKADDPLYPCNAVGDKYKITCYMMQTSYMLKLNNGNFADTFRLCSNVGEDYEATCYQSIGRDASGRTISNVEATKKNCSFAENTRQLTHCAIGAVKDFVSYYHDDKEGRKLCASFENEDVRATCNRTIDSYYKSFSN